MELISAFHRALCQVKVLDPACGTGNFLYVSLELMKELEGEVLLALEELGAGAQAVLDMQGLTVGPQQFIGLEKNGGAVPIAELVLWLGHLQGHLRLRGPESLSDPILKPIETVREMDAVLAWKKRELVLGPDGKPVARWDGLTMRTDPLTGRQVPDETAVRELYRFTDPKPAPWPKADFIVGNPPFIGGKDLRQELGDGYAEALWAAYPHMPGGADFVMYWWDRAADLVRDGKARRFGFITTNSITQTFSRRAIKRHLEAKKPLHLSFAIPDHPWADAHGSAAVRVAMTVGVAGPGEGLLKQVVREGEANPNDGAIAVDFAIEQGVILADLTIGADVVGAESLRANELVASMGVKLHGEGFIVSASEIPNLSRGVNGDVRNVIKPFRNGRDIMGKSRGLFAIDLHGYDIDQVRSMFPSIYQLIRDKVKPERDFNNEAYRRENWWLYGRKSTEFRNAVSGLNRYVATCRTARHRIFQFLNGDILPESKIVAICVDKPWLLGVLSSRFHIAFAEAAGGWLGVGNDSTYNHSECFYKFPFPILTPAQEARIGALAEELDGLRKRVLADNDGRFTLTELYNVLEKRRAGADFTPAEKDIYDAGHVGVLLDLHRDLDAAVADAYGWPVDLPGRDILMRLVALNKQRAAEEAQGLIRWLRPDFQNPAGAGVQTQLVADLGETAVAAKRPAWPKLPAEQVQALLRTLSAANTALPADAVARQFKGARGKAVQDMLDLLVSIGQARRVTGGGYAA